MGKSKPKSSSGQTGPAPKFELQRALFAEQRAELLVALETRFSKNMDRHAGIAWDAVRARLDARDGALASLYAMESTGGEPDVIGHDSQTGAFIFCDCARQSPAGRRSICYDGAGQAEREKKQVYPAGNAVDMAAAMGLDLLDEAQYVALQKLGEFDTTTSSWLATPAGVRERGGAIFGDFRYGRVFIYHNGAGSFYGARGFRGLLRV